jgi:hypothetical protein
MGVLNLHGENGITYALFNDLTQNDKVSDFLDYVHWTEKSDLKGLKVESVHLFPSFGRGQQGIGEPDAMIITNKFIFYVEVETSEIQKLGSHFESQFRRFMVLGKSVKESNQKKVRTYFRITDDKKVRGQYRTRKIIKDLLEKDREPYYILICDGRHKRPKHFLESLQEKFSEKNIGFINFFRIKRLQFISRKTIDTINFNLKK